VVVITPFTAYKGSNGVFRGDGFAASLRELTGSLVRTIRWIGLEAVGQRKDSEVEWQGGGVAGLFLVGLEEYCELMDVDPGVEIIATLKSRQPILRGKPAVIQRKLGGHQDHHSGLRCI
jgi:hypothetical protein